MTYLQNKYTLTYFRIIDKARSRHSLNEYSELHHIVPKCIGGTNEKINLVRLTAREHFICHWLLTKMVTGTAYYKLEKSLACFTRSSNTQERVMSSAMYARAKLAASLAMKNRPSPNKGRKMKTPPWNKGKIIGPNPKVAAAQKGVPKPLVSLKLSGRKRPDISARQNGKRYPAGYTKTSNHEKRPSPLKGRPNGRKGIPTGRPPANKGLPSPLTGLSGKNKGRYHWTNGTDDRVSSECPGEGWYRGRSSIKGKKVGPMTADRKQKISLAKKAKPVTSTNTSRC